MGSENESVPKNMTENGAIVLPVPEVTVRNCFESNCDWLEMNEAIGRGLLVTARIKLYSKRDALKMVIRRRDK